MYSRAQAPVEKLGKIYMRFWKRVEINRKTKCWEWQGSHHALGYGKVSFNGKVRQAHRAAWEMLVGPLADDLHIDHLCKNPSCVNPAHLEPVTQRENIMRGECPAARQARRTHCIRGHALKGKNLLMRKVKGSRFHRDCRVCKTARDANRDWSSGKSLGQQRLEARIAALAGTMGVEVDQSKVEQRREMRAVFEGARG